MKSSIVLSLLVVLSGCESLLSSEQAAVNAAKVAVDYYCSKSDVARSIVRESVAAKIAPHKIIVQCAE